VQNQQLQEPPELVETWYSEPLERSLTTLQVLDTQGEPVHVGEAVFSGEDNRYAAIGLPADLAPGIYTLTFENVSTVDAHVWSGFFSFIILNEDGTVPEGDALIPSGLAGQTGFLPDNLDSVLRWFGLIAMVALAGGLFFSLLVGRPAAQFLENGRRRVAEGSLAGTVAVVVVAAASVVVLTTIGQALWFADRVDRLDELGQILFNTRLGELWVARVGLALALLFLFIPAIRSEEYRSGRAAALSLIPASIGGLGLIMTYVLGSHSAAGGGQFWRVASDFTHFAATAAWLGALVQLPIVFWWAKQRLEGPSQVLYLANVMDRFSWLSAVSVTILIGTGVFNGFVQLPTFESLYETTYGRVLIVKLALIIPLLVVAAFNALYMKPRLVEAVDVLNEDDPELRASGDEQIEMESRLERLQRLLPRTAIAEFLLGAAVLASVSLLAQSTTADGELRLDAAQPSGQHLAVGVSRDIDMELLIEPFGIGLNNFTLTMTALEGEELGDVLGARLTATFRNPDVSPSAGTTGVFQELTSTDTPGVWGAEAVLLTQPGDWSIESRVQRRDQEDTNAIFSIQDVGGFLSRDDEPEGLYDLPFTFVDWNVVGGGAMLAFGLGVFLIWHNRPPSWRRGTATSVGLSSAFSMVAGAILLFGVHGDQAVQFDEPTAESIRIGQEIFVNTCAACHGLEGEGDGPLAATLPYPPPRLGDHVPFHGPGTLFLWVSEGLPSDADVKIMPAFKDVFSEEELKGIIDYLRATWTFGDYDPVLPDDLRTPEGDSP
jgi:copper transport protein